MSLKIIQFLSLLCSKAFFITFFLRQLLARTNYRLIKILSNSRFHHKFKRNVLRNKFE
jgi:hypothetical protein